MMIKSFYLLSVLCVVDNSAKSLSTLYDGFSTASPKHNQTDGNLNSYLDELRLIQIQIDEEDHGLDVRGATNISQLKWPKAGNGFVDVPYCIGTDVAPKTVKAIMDAINIFSWYTCVKLRPAVVTDFTYLKFVGGKSCSSYIGRQGFFGWQEIEMAKQCGAGISTAIHEIMHAIGFFHQHARPDRDEYIKIFPENIRNGKENNFEMNHFIDSFGFPYDQDSVMHYNSFAFSKNDRPTILTKSGKEVYYQSGGFSPIDIAQINLFYDCQGLNESVGRSRTDCYYAEDKGLSYRGTVATTSGGVNCTEWVELGGVEFQNYALVGIEKNYCRNLILKDAHKPFCYVASSRRLVYCDVPECGELKINSTTGNPSSILTTRASKSCRVHTITLFQTIISFLYLYYTCYTVVLEY